MTRSSYLFYLFSSFEIDITRSNKGEKKDYHLFILGK